MAADQPAGLDELWEAIPTGPAPVERLVARGRAARRRRRGMVVGGLAAAGAVAVTGFLIHSAGAQDTIATPLAGTRYVGIGQLAVAVPVGWDDRAASCNTPVRDTVFFPYPQDCVSAFHGETSSVALTTGAFSETGTSLDDLAPAGLVGGHQVVESPETCPVGQGESCHQVFGVPDLHVYFTVTVPQDVDGAYDQVRAIRESLTELPGDQTAVPFVAPGSPLATWRSTLEEAGFLVREERHTCPPTANCGPGFVSTSPDAGNVLPRGSTVTIEVQD